MKVSIKIENEFSNTFSSFLIFHNLYTYESKEITQQLSHYAAIYNMSSIHADRIIFNSEERRLY